MAAEKKKGGTKMNAAVVGRAQSIRVHMPEAGSFRVTLSLRATGKLPAATDDVFTDPDPGVAMAYALKVRETTGLAVQLDDAVVSSLAQDMTSPAAE